MDSARELFTLKGFHGVSSDEIVGAASVTRGALYHHFPSGKEELFRVVVEELIEAAVSRVVEELRASGPSGDRWESVMDGMHRYLDICLRPDHARIVLVDGPAVLGVPDVVSMSERALGHHWRSTLLQLMRAGEIDRLPTAPLAHLLATNVEAAAIYVSQSSDPRRARRQVGKVLDRMLEGLRPSDRAALPIHAPTLASARAATVTETSQP